MTLVPIGNHQVNADNVAYVKTGVSAQPPGKPAVDDAVRVHFIGDTPALTFFGDDAVAAVVAFAPPKPALAPAKPTPAPTPAPAAAVKS